MKYFKKNKFPVFFYKLRSLIYFFRSFLYLGSKYHCPCCGGNFRKFITYGVQKRPNAKCPRCGSMERHRTLWLFLKNKTNVYSDEIKLLHFAPEYIFRENFLKHKTIAYYSADIESPLAKHKVDITKIKFNDNFFDAIICNHVLEHIIDDAKAMKELFRVLKPGAWAILQVPQDTDKEDTYEDENIVDPKEREKHFGQHDHVRVYGLDYKNRLESAGFKVEVIDFLNIVGEENTAKFSLREHGGTGYPYIYFCTK